MSEASNGGVSSSSGRMFSITTFGESHGPGIGVVIDGCPAGIAIDSDFIQRQLTRRRPGQNRLTTPRNEEDRFQILSGVYEGRTLGTPIALFVPSTDVKSGDYYRWADVYRPSHADFTYHAKYGYRTPIGGGRASVRETIGRVAAGALAAQILREEFGTEVIAWVDSIGKTTGRGYEHPPTSIDEVDASIVRSHIPDVSERMIQEIEQARLAGDSVGGTICVIVRNVPPGLGEPVFDKLEAEVAKACLSIPACKGFESGSGFAGTTMRGSEHNDAFFVKGKDAASTEGEDDESDTDAESMERVRPGYVPNPVHGVENVPELYTKTNRSGGIQGGISNGMPLLFRLAFKPTATVRKRQVTANESGEPITLRAGGRHDPCVVPRAVPIVESAIHLVLMDMMLRQRAIHPEWWLRYSKNAKNYLSKMSES